MMCPNCNIEMERGMFHFTCAKCQFMRPVNQRNSPLLSERKVILLVTGSRTITDKVFVYQCLDKTCKPNRITKIIQGGAGGVDTLAYYYANALGLLCGTYEAKWQAESEDKFGKYQYYDKGAGFKRNAEMVKVCNLGIAIWDGKSKGTKHTIDLLKKANKLIEVFLYK